MTRDVVSWMVGHPAVVTALDAILLRDALQVAPDQPQLLETRLRSLFSILLDEVTEGADVPPFALTLPFSALLEGTYDEFLRLLPTGSLVRIDARSVRTHLDAAGGLTDHLHELGVLSGLSGLSADGTEDDLVRLVRPDTLVFDRRPPLDYRDRMTRVLRLRAEPGPARSRREVVVCGVTTAVEEWAAVTCGASLLAGPLYDAVDLVEVATHGRVQPKVFRGQGEPEGSVFEMAAARYPSEDEPLTALLEWAVPVGERVIALASQANVYIVAGLSTMPERVVRGIEAMATAGVAVTVVGAGLFAPPVPGITWARLATTDPLARDWAFVALLPGEGHLVVGLPIGEGTDMLQARTACVHAQDRELAVRIANRISRSVAAAALDSTH